MEHNPFKVLRNFTLFCLLLLGNTSLFADNLPQHSPVPGGIAVLLLPASIQSNTQPPEVYYRDNRVLVIADEQQHWQAVVGIPLKAKPGTHSLLIKESNGEVIKNTFRVESKSYKEQRITLSNKRQVNPAPVDLERIGREKKIMVSAFNNWNTHLTPSLTLTKPVDGPYSSPFGLRRFFNDQPRNPHSGVDIAAPEGTPIKAPSKAIVAATGDYFFNGKTVLLDHGQGLISMYCHLSQINVEKGETVDTNKIIGLVGKTGRVTGPHLHWSVSLNNARINPFLLMPQESDN